MKTVCLSVMQPERPLFCRCGVQRGSATTTMLLPVVALSSPALLLPIGPTAPPMALSAAPRFRVAPGWLLMQEEAAEPEAEPEAVAAATDDAAEAEPDERAQLKEQIAALERELVDARGELLAEQAAAKDAGM